MLKICLTYDYELFMGKNSASAEEILFEPTRKIKEAMDEFGVKGVFFADVCSAIAHRDAGLSEFSDAFDEQLKELTSDGHDVQLHIHTSWLKAKNENGRLVLSPDGYRIHEFGFDETKDNSVQKIIRNGVEYLNSVCKSAREDYNCIAYRAGGFCVQPEKELFDILLNNGVIIDSSVVPRYFSLDGVNCSDFRKVPHKLNWLITPDDGISKASTYGLFEVPIISVKPRLIECLTTSREERSLPGAQMRGEFVGHQFVDKKKSIIRKRIEGLLKYRFISLDSRHYKAILNDLEFIYKKYRLHKNDAYLCLICHPKLADDIRVENLKKLISEVLLRKDKFEFTTMKEIAQKS